VLFVDDLQQTASRHHPVSDMLCVSDIITKHWHRTSAVPVLNRMLLSSSVAYLCLFEHLWSW